MRIHKDYQRIASRLEDHLIDCIVCRDADLERHAELENQRLADRAAALSWEPSQLPRWHNAEIKHVFGAHGGSQ